MNPSQCVELILKNKIISSPSNFKDAGYAFAPSNIALVKYWGKRNAQLNLPLTSSLSISLQDRGTTTKISRSENAQDHLFIDQKSIPSDAAIFIRLQTFLNLFRPHPDFYFHVETQSTIPIAAGLASSASAFASVVLALNDFFDWNLSQKDASILARLGSGSAARSIWHGFVKWQAGVQEDGLDSHGIVVPVTWPQFRVGLLLLTTKEKSLSSRIAMERTLQTSPFAHAWVKTCEHDLATLEAALLQKDFVTLGETAEANAMAMHALMLSSRPSICYDLPETILHMHHIFELRKQGLPLYFTQDAGPNLKLLFLESDTENVKAAFPNVEIVRPF